MENNAREELDELVKSPGWQRFCAHVEKEWGNSEKGGGAMFTHAAHKAANNLDEIVAVNQLRQICVAQREIHALIAWVNGSLKDATKRDQEFATAAPADYSRRGGL